MKKISILTCFFLALACTSWAQSMSNKKTADISEAEVPVAIRSVYERDYASISGEGTWSVYYSTTKKDGKIIATPIWYTFSGKSGGQKTELRFLPDGKLKSSKGIAVKQDLEEKELRPDQKSST